MSVDRETLDALGRGALIEEARRWGVRRPEVMTRVELVDEIVRIGTPNPVERKNARGWFGVARDLLASVVDRGLNLPDAAAFIRGEVRFESMTPPPAAVATVTLAEIYGAQGHLERALTTLDQVLTTEPEHTAAQELRERLHRDQIRRSELPPPLDEVNGERRIEVVTEDAAPEGDSESPAEPDRGFLRPSPEASDVLSDDGVDGDDEVATLPPPLDDGPLTLPPLDDGRHTAPLDDGPLTLPPLDDGRHTPPLDDGPLTPRTPTHVRREFGAALVRTGATAVVYYEVDAGALGAEPVVVRVVEVRPGNAGSKRVQHDLLVDSELGIATLPPIPPSAVLRAAVGVRSESGFRALVVAPELTHSPSGLAVSWAPRRGVDYRGIAARAGARLASRGD